MIHPIAASSSSSSSTLAPAARDSDARPRNRRLIARATDAGSSLSTPGHSPTRDASPIPAARIGSVTGRNDATVEVARSRGKSPAVARGLFDSSWAPSWASVQGFANSLLGGSETDSREGSQTGRPRRQASYGDVSQKTSSWGPEPPSSRRPQLQDVGAGSMAEREAALRAMRTASVLESHEGVNGGLDVTGNFKKRNSDEVTRDGGAQQQEVGEHLVYIHHVQPSDTYAGIVLKYKCREDAFRKANGLWSRDGIQVRKWLALPVDACEVRGRPCQGPTESGKVDLLARTPEETDPFGNQISPQHDDFFSNAPNGQSNQQYDEDRPWTHVRWVSIDSCPHPVEIARVPRKALGYFPPRRKKSVHTTSTLTTPRGSLDTPNITLGSDPGVGGMGSPGSVSSRRPSVLSNRPQLGPASSSASTSRTRGGSVGAGSSVNGEDLLKPAWMRRPGGVGSLGRHVRAPGPEKDYFNSWTKKHLPSLTMESLPSMSVMGTEVARIGFGKVTDNPTAAIAESPFEDGQTAGSAATGGAQGTGLDKAAAAVESWLRGAFAKRNGPGTPVLGPRGRATSDGVGEGDLIELENTNSDDGNGNGNGLGDLLGHEVFGPTGWSADSTGTQPAFLLRSMPICIECRHPVKTLWREGAGDKAGGHNIRLTVCKNCGRFCDKYVEHDFVVLFIDLVLIKPQVYRHLLHNTLMKDEDEFAPSIIRLGILLLLFDVYLTWARIERQSSDSSSSDRLASQPIVYQYLFFLLLCTLSTLAFHGSIRFLSSSRYSPLALLGILPQYSRPNSVSTALLVSSSTKLFPILMVIWEYDVPAAARSLGWAVVANNVEALKILLGCGYGVAALLATAGALSRWAMGRAVLWAAGLEGVDSAGESSYAEDGRALGALLMRAMDWAGRLAVG
ncbi:Arv1-like family-domain-containing protein [Podospora aff. communis PSN243]|uniref:Protein ARV n=1 Tax=Podospora aff. communis PSN243 TaxID=3040156 RepID=A0AAV9GNZ7_9PEZI|nr:Arv1-like family-domain-containing protein [Podospora aff. communis PSN243]